ncbi:MAG: lipoprotein-releasing system ATP-binding protein LolD [Candidatus Marinimicrobia bacterium]|nr:lipoprotein-releasing system ATP-binding protein LolD [Candidatus Neomarinimicrobiota bacterium]|tara:strand:- start:22753 stop:23421 length:669 start_codon:yes stop_codon:yes gene_type:complete
MRIIELKNIKKSYVNGDESIVVLENLCLGINKNDIITIFGNSGVGKSTLLSIVSGMLKADSGQVIINGNSLNKNNSLKIRRNYLGILFQDNNLLSEFSVMENLMLPMLINGQTKNKAIFNAEYLLNLINMDQYSYRYPRTLSKGEAQRIALLRCIANTPKIVIADEPTANLDENNCKLLLELIVKLNKSLDITFLIATHDERFLSISSNSYKLFNGDLSSNE